ncbi:hypothetical protein [Amphibacillus xylanus]|nr:hypothetical protein [Amphibacillus xylanus]
MTSRANRINIILHDTKQKQIQENDRLSQVFVGNFSTLIMKADSSF